MMRPQTPIPVAAVGVLLTVAAASASPLRPELLRDPGAAWTAIPPEPRAQAAPPAPGAFAPAGAVTQGGRHWNPHPRVLVILADFDDRPAQAGTYPPAHFQDLLFSEGVLEHGSLREYYSAVSNGRMLFSGETVGWFRMPLSYAEYAGTSSGLCNCYPSSRTLISDAVDAALIAGVNFREFDNDGPDGIPGSGDDDGILDGLIVVFAGLGAERTGLSTDIRSHFRSVSPRLVGGILVPDAVVVPEAENVGIAVHEVGHLLGGEDLYDESLAGAGLGNYSVMAYGNWLGNATEPGGPDPYTRILWGVAEPDTLRFDEPAYPVDDVHENPKVPLLWTGGEPGPEYFLVENRPPAGVDHYLPGDGLLVYHVDLTQRSQDNPQRYRVALVQADGLHNLEGIDPINPGDAGDYFPGTGDVRRLDDTTVPDTHGNGGDPTQVVIRNIEDPGPRMTTWLGIGNYIASGPIPELEVEPEAGFFGGDVESGTDRVWIVIRNLGTRMEGGSLRVFSRDPRIRIDPVVDLPVEALGVRSIRTLPDPVMIHLRNGDGRDVLPLEVAWTAPGGTYRMAAPLPLAGTRIATEGFESADSGVQSSAILSGGNPWRRESQTRIEGSWAWGTPGYGPHQNGVVELPPFVLPEGYSELRFTHLLSTESLGNYGFDGGFLEMSRDGGLTWVPLEPRGGYPGTFLSTSGNPYAGHLAWFGSTNGWKDEVVPLPWSGEVRVRFHFVSDYTGSNGLYAGWFVDAVVVRSWASDHAGVVQSTLQDGVIHLDVGVLPIVPDRDIAGGVTLFREAGLLHEDLGHWAYSGRLDDRVDVLDPVPGAVERYWLRWDVVGEPPTGPFLVTVPGGAGGFFARTPGVIERGGGSRIGYNVPGDAPMQVHLDVFDVQGRRVARLVDALQEPGYQEVAWPARSPGGSAFAAGVYFLHAGGDGLSETHRIVLVP